MQPGHQEGNLCAGTAQQQGKERVLGSGTAQCSSRDIKSQVGAIQLALRDGQSGGDLYSTLITPRGRQDVHGLGLGEQGMLQIMSGNHCRAMGRELSEQHLGSCKCF